LEDGSDTESEDFVLGYSRFRSDEYLDPSCPAKQIYLLLDNPTKNFRPEVYIQALFVPSDVTRTALNMRPVPRNFNQSFDSWVISHIDYKDQYGFPIPLGRYDPGLQLKKEMYSQEESDDDDLNNSPEKRTREAI
jgi:hypothetical protein